MKIKSIKQIKNLAGKKVLLRTDFDVPVSRGKIGDDFRIAKQLPTIRYLLNQQAKIIIISHLGRPHPLKKEPNLSLRPVAERLEKLLKHKINFLTDHSGFNMGNHISRMKDQEIVMLENLRYSAGEEKNDKKFAKELAILGNFYVNDAFAVCHRNHASVSAIKSYLPAYAGLLLEAELENLNKVLNPNKPLIIVMGGAKIDTKLPLIYKLHSRAAWILVGGALANNFFAAKGYDVGRSLVDKTSIDFARNFRSRKIILPIDVVTSNKAAGGTVTAKPVTQVKKLEFIFDIGPKTIRLYASYIKKANTIVWNGPMGVFEKEEFKHGTLSVGRVIAARSTGRAFGVVGGGETVEALKMTKMLPYIDWVSTGGGAMLAYLGGEKMPGLAKIVK